MKKFVLASIGFLAANCALAAPLEVFEMKADPLNTVGITKNPIYVSSNHRAGVRNNTDQVQEITVWYSLCASTCDSNKGGYRIKINPHSTWQDGATLHLVERYYNPGYFQVTAKTQISGPFNLNQTTMGYASIQVN